MSTMTEEDERYIAQFTDPFSTVSSDDCLWMANRLKELLNADYDRNKTVRDANDHGVGVWHWQGDGEDHPESLICPVLMSADQVREFIKETETGKKMAWDTLRALGWNDTLELLENFRYDGTLTDRGQHVMKMAGALHKILCDKAENAENLEGFEYPQVVVSLTPSSAAILIDDIGVWCSEGSPSKETNVAGCLKMYRDAVDRLQRTLP